jgi:hypothetical protein
MPTQWTNSLNWISSNTDIPSSKISKFCPDILNRHMQDPNAKSGRNASSHLGISKQILKALTMLPYQLRSAGLICPVTPQSDLEIQMEIESESSPGKAHVITISTGTNNSGNKKATLYHTCKGLSDSHPCYHMLMALIIYDLYANQNNEFPKLFRNNDINSWDTVGLLRTADEFYFDIKEGKIPQDINFLSEISMQPYIIDLTSFIIYGSPVESPKMREIFIDINRLLETSDSAANTALLF